MLLYFPVYSSRLLLLAEAQKKFHTNVFKNLMTRTPLNSEEISAKINSRSQKNSCASIFDEIFHGFSLKLSTFPQVHDLEGGDINCTRVHRPSL